jgi:5-oxoprolinase (ATP-hydrolysing) subunit A
MANSIDINADLGEGADAGHITRDLLLLDLVSSANIACGYHAGNARTMAATVRAAEARGVAIGAHPSYPDIPGFGRRELGLSPAQIRFHVTAQVRSMTAICEREGARLRYVKPHGALYNRAATEKDVARAIVDAIHDVDASLVLLGLASSEMQRAANARRIRFVREAFVDRSYRADGTLVPRGQPGAIIGDTRVAVARAVALVRDGLLPTENRGSLQIDAESLCVHGDNPDAASLLRALRAGLEAAGVSVAPFA